jgi:hypothetical protein
MNLQWIMIQTVLGIVLSLCARRNLRHTAFIELNQKAVVDVMYSDDLIKLYKGMRVMGVDGSKIVITR